MRRTQPIESEIDQVPVAPVGQETSISVRFVVFSAARSGTSLLVETLNKHPQIYCHGEIFHEQIEWHIRKEYRDAFHLSQRQTNPVGFCYSILAFTNNRNVVGFKIWRDQCREASIALLRDPAIKKIILDRENRLAQYSSGVLARQTGIWNVTLYEGETAPRVNSERIGFSAAAFAKFVDYQRDVFQTYDREAQGDVLRLTYANVARLDFEPIYRFLGVEPIETIAAKAKLHPSEIWRRFDPGCYDEIKRCLSELGHPEWVSERL
jgi:LPS sulfotransferase NodH